MQTILAMDRRACSVLIMTQVIVVQRQIQVKHIPANEQIADVLTNAISSSFLLLLFFHMFGPNVQ